MGEAPYALALAAGMVAAVNPCGFALLPGYVSLVVVEGAGPGPSRLASLRRALAMTAAMTGGFVAVFGLFGLAVTPLALSVERWLPWVTIVVGVGLVGFGVALTAGRQVALRLPKPPPMSHSKPGSVRVGGSLWSTVAYGVSYAVASLSCTVGPFLAVTASAFSSSGLLAGVGVFTTYAAGMGLVVGVVTVAAALARDSVTRRLRRALPHVTRAGGVLLSAAGLYVTYYGWYELRVFGGADAADPVVGAATRVQAELQRALADAGAGVVAAALGVLVAAALIVALAAGRHRNRRDRRRGTAPPGPAPGIPVAGAGPTATSSSRPRASSTRPIP